MVETYLRIIIYVLLTDIIIICIGTRRKRFRFTSFPESNLKVQQRE